MFNNVVTVGEKLLCFVVMLGSNVVHLELGFVEQQS